MSSLLYLAYGSNLLPRRLRERTPSAQLRATVRLRGWALRFHKRGQDRSAKCNLLRTAAAATDTAHGAVYEIAADERVFLDRAEGLGRGYELHWLDTDTFGRVFLYLAAETHIDESLRPFSWYRALVEAGALHHGFPASYVSKIRMTETRADPDRQRHRQHLVLLNRTRRIVTVPPGFGSRTGRMSRQPRD